MNHGAVSVRPVFAVVLAALVLIAVTTVLAGRLNHAGGVATAALRAVGQLGAVALLITAVLRSWWASAGFITLMVLVAAATSARRISSLRLGWPVLIPIAVGSLPICALVVTSGAVPLTQVAVVPIAGILVGGAMTAASLAGRRALDELRDRHGEYEAALALGLAPRDAALEICRPSAGQALVPALDQTRTVGLVTLPGAFVGVLLGGGTPVQAGATQLLVLVALLAVEAIAVAVTVELVANGLLSRPGPPHMTRSPRRLVTRSAG
ncbi:ABC transporter permease [Micromonospora sp. DT227]|uniref:ABC transporter permease n=1 Tax=Micromonospora sp. DT227 TaxID=3393433 RepID=UPI003CEB7DAE